MWRAAFPFVQPLQVAWRYAEQVGAFLRGYHQIGVDSLRSLNTPNGSCLATENQHIEKAIGFPWGESFSAGGRVVETRNSREIGPIDLLRSKRMRKRHRGRRSKR